MDEILKMINLRLTEAGINYEFMEWTSEIVYPYFVGEYNEIAPSNESGERDITFILNGFTRSSFSQLLSCAKTIENLFPAIEGKLEMLESGSAVAVFYEDSTQIQTGIPDLKRIQINLSIKEWRV